MVVRGPSEGLPGELNQEAEPGGAPRCRRSQRRLSGGLAVNSLENQPGCLREGLLIVVRTETSLTLTDFHLISTCVLEVSPTNKTGHEQKQRRSLEKGLRPELIGHVTPAALSLIRNPRPRQEPGFSLKTGSLT